MASSIVIGIDVFADSDLEHPCAAVRRIAGGVYRVVLHGQDLAPRDDSGIRARNDFDSIEEALQFAMDIAVLVEKDPALMSPASVHATALARQAEEALEAERAARKLERSADVARIAQLEAQLAKVPQPATPIVAAETPKPPDTKAR